MRNLLVNNSGNTLNTKIPTILWKKSGNFFCTKLKSYCAFIFSVQEEDVHGAHRRLSAEMIFIELVSQRIRKVTVKKSYFPFS